MWLKALPKSTTETTNELYRGRFKMPGPRGRRELTTMQMAKQLSRGQSRLPDLTREVSAKVNPCQSGRLCVGGRVNQATTRMWSLINQAATKIWGRDLQEPVSSLVLAMVGEASPDLSYCLVCPAGAGRGWLRMMNRTTISAHEAFSTGRVPVGRGRQKHLKSFWGVVKINKASENKHKNRKGAVYIM